MIRIARNRQPRRDIASKKVDDVRETNARLEDWIVRGICGVVTSIVFFGSRLFYLAQRDAKRTECIDA